MGLEGNAVAVTAEARAVSGLALLDVVPTGGVGLGARAEATLRDGAAHGQGGGAEQEETQDYGFHLLFLCRRCSWF